MSLLFTATVEVVVVTAVVVVVVTAVVVVIATKPFWLKLES